LRLIQLLLAIHFCLYNVSQVPYLVMCRFTLAGNVSSSKNPDGVSKIAKIRGDSGCA
jgi:hypothetical protein